MTTEPRQRDDERGIAMVVTMFMVLLLAALGSAMMFISRTEALSSLNYKTMSQARYAAESGLHAAANQLLYNYTPPSSNTADSMAFYNWGNSPVLYNNAAVVLSSEPSVAANYPLAGVANAFSASSQGTLSAGVGTASYTASARLLSMRMFIDTITNSYVTLQTWLITGRGSVAGVGSAQVEVSAIVERQERPVFGYAAFATDPGCAALNLGGDFSTDSYDSRVYGGSGLPTPDSYGGNVGTNGNLTIGGSADVAGSLSTPRAGVGSCSGGSVTALTGSTTKVSEGMTQLPQSIDWPTPPAPSPTPPTSSDSFTKSSGCPASLSSPICVTSANGATITPSGTTPVVLGNMSLGNQAVVHLNAGTYIVNSLDLGAQGEIVLDSGPVVIQIAGQGVSTPFDANGGTFANNTFDPSKFQIVYGGTAALNMNGGAAAAGIVYAPNATVNWNGNADFYGAMLAKKFNMTGTATIHYDRALDTKGLTVGNPTMSSFTWRSF